MMEPHTAIECGLAPGGKAPRGERWRRGLWRAGLALALAAIPAIIPDETMAGTKAGTRFGDWTYECAAIADAKTDCALVQVLIAQRTKKAVAKFRLGHGPEAGAARLTAILPLGIDLRSTVMGIVDGREFAFTAETCVRAGCLFSVTPDPDFLAAMAAGKELTVSFKLRGAAKITVLKGSLSGISAGMKAMGLL